MFCHCVPLGFQTTLTLNHKLSCLWTLWDLTPDLGSVSSTWSKPLAWPSVPSFFNQFLLLKRTISAKWISYFARTFLLIQIHQLCQLLQQSHFISALTSAHKSHAPSHYTNTCLATPCSSKSQSFLSLSLVLASTVFNFLVLRWQFFIFSWMTTRWKPGPLPITKGTHSRLWNSKAGPTQIPENCGLLP